jgi:polar amino acid transport system permease protein
VGTRMWGFYLKELIHTVPFFLKGLWMTAAVSGFSLIAGTAVGFAWGIIRAGKNKILRSILGAWVDLIRGTPFLVQIFIVFFILPEVGIQLDAFSAAVIALGNSAACFICEIVAGGILAVPFGQREAATASGLTSYQQFRYIILPQALRIILPPLVGQYVLTIKDSSVVSAIGVVDVTRVGWFTVQRIPEGILVFGLVGILYFVICYPLIRLSNTLENRMAVVTTRL